ncbi:hypothetical protein SCAR479_02249 [Seiridium cardinale]|uniref:Xylanolytic transcriptional activator regulatory domain-containing protein n=1 Tax=Seiridium cardinale TaxID=138064 RepID=A0ABR2X5H3_9PEZI
MENVLRRSGLSQSAADSPNLDSEASSITPDRGNDSKNADPVTGKQTTHMANHRHGDAPSSPNSERDLVVNYPSPMEVPGLMVSGTKNHYFMGVYLRRNELQRLTQYEKLQQQTFAPVFSSEPNKNFIGPVFDEVIAPLPIFQWSSFETGLDKRDSFKDPVWRTCANATLAITTCFRAASSAFDELQGVAWAYFKGAFAAFPELMVRGESLGAIEAIIAMAMFVRGSPDTQTLSLLLSSASRLYQIIHLRHGTLPIVPTTQDNQRRVRVYWTLYTLDQELSLKQGLPQTFDSDNNIVIEPLNYDSTNTPMVNAFHKRTKLATIESTIYKRLYMTHSNSRDVQGIMKIAHDLDSSLEQWRQEPGALVRFDPETSAFENLDTPMIIYIIGLHLAYYNCIQTIHWPTERFPKNEFSPLLTESARDGQSSPGVPASKSATAAQMSLSLVVYVSTLPFSSFWSFLNYFISDYIILLATVISQPAEPKTPLQLLAMRSFVQALRKISVEERFNLERILEGCDRMANIAQSAIEVAFLGQSSSQQRSMNDKAQVVLNLIDQATHPIYLAQNFMSNLKNKDYGLSFAIAQELGIPWDLEQRYGPFVPESLMPETYAFAFEVVRNPLMCHEGADPYM